jgi:4-oxalocrotonate tautomerase
MNNRIIFKEWLKMPVITVKMAKGRTGEQKQQFVEAITKEAVKTLNVKEEWITVIFDEYDRENWASNGQLHSLKFGEGFGKKGTE